MPGAEGAARRHPRPPHPGRERRDAVPRRRSRARCCSTTSARSCTRATRRSPSGAPRPWRSTASSSPSCSAPRSCASSRSWRQSPTSSSSSRRWHRRVAPAPSTPSATCCAGSATCEPMRSPRARTAWTLRARSRSSSRRRRAIRVRVAGEERWIAVEDAGRYRDAVGASPPPGVAETFLEPVDAAARPAAARWARTHAPFTAEEPAVALGPGARRGRRSGLRAMAASGALLEGTFRPGGTAHEFTDPDVLRQLRRRSLARLRREVEPVDPDVLARFLPAWHGVGRHGRWRWAGWSRWSPSWRAFPFRPRSSSATCCRPGCAGYTPRLLDELGAAGEVVWIGRGSLGRDDGRICALPSRPGRPAGRCRRVRGASIGAGPRSNPPAPPAPGRVVLPAAARGRARCAHRRRAARRDVGPGLGRRADERHVRRRCARCRCRAAGRSARRGPAASWRSARRAPPADGRWWPTSSARRERRPSAATPSPPASSSATGSSPARPSRRRASPAATHRSIRCSAPWRSPVGPGAATSSRASARRSLRMPGAVDRLRAVRDDEPRRSHPGRDRSGPALRRRPALAAMREATSGCRSSAPPAPTSYWSTARRRCTSSAAGAGSFDSRPAADPERAARAVAALSVTRRAGGTDAGAAHRAGRSRAGGRLSAGRGHGGGRLPAGLPRLVAAAAVRGGYGAGVTSTALTTKWVRQLNTASSAVPNSPTCSWASAQSAESGWSKLPVMRSHCPRSGRSTPLAGSTNSRCCGPVYVSPGDQGPSTATASSSTSRHGSRARSARPDGCCRRQPQTPRHSPAPPDRRGAHAARPTFLVRASKPMRPDRSRRAARGRRSPGSRRPGRGCS